MTRILRSPFFLWTRDFFVGPLIKQKPKRMDGPAYLHEIFRCDKRIIIEAVNIEGITFSGKTMAHGMGRATRVENKTYPPGISWLIRVDQDEDFVDFQTRENVYRVKKCDYERNYKDKFRFTGTDAK